MFYSFQKISYYKKQAGFTLIEISVVIAILAIIASLVAPSYKKLIGKIKQTEAKVVLQSIYVAQTLYFAQNEIYTDDIDELDIELPPDSKYRFTIDVNNNNYIVTAESNIDSDITLDKWTINKNKELTNSINDIYE